LVQTGHETRPCLSASMFSLKKKLSPEGKMPQIDNYWSRLKQ